MFSCPRCGTAIAQKGVPTHVDGIFCRAAVLRAQTLARGLVALSDGEALMHAEAGAPLERLPTKTKLDPRYDHDIDTGAMIEAWGRADVSRAIRGPGEWHHKLPAIRRALAQEAATPPPAETNHGRARSRRREAGHVDV